MLDSNFFLRLYFRHLPMELRVDIHFAIVSRQCGNCETLLNIRFLYVFFPFFYRSICWEIFFMLECRSKKKNKNVDDDNDDEEEAFISQTHKFVSRGLYYIYSMSDTHPAVLVFNSSCFLSQPSLPLPLIFC